VTAKRLLKSYKPEKIRQKTVTFTIVKLPSKPTKHAILGQNPW